MTRTEVEKIQKAWAFLTRAIEAIIKAFKEVLDRLRKGFKAFVEFLARIPRKQRNSWTKRVLYHGSIIAGKSNNWRRMHGIPMIRRK